MLYWVVAGALALWVLIDGMRRAGPVCVLWALGAFLFPFIVVPIYFAVRALKDGETREGGTGWRGARERLGTARRRNRDDRAQNRAQRSSELGLFPPGDGHRLHCNINK